MTRRLPLFIGLSAVGIVMIVSAYLEMHPAEPGAHLSVADVSPQAAAPAARPAVAATPAPSADEPKTVAQLIADSSDADATKRAAAIAALAEAPRAEALPVLGRILTDGEPQIDRPLALRSLRELALSQGDDDGAIRDAVRHAIYHGDDFTKADEVQEALDIIEESQKR